MRIVLFLLIASTRILTGQDASQLVRVSVQRELRAKDDGRNYTYRYTDIERELTRDGVTKSARTRTYEAVFLYGRQFVRLVSEEGDPKASEDIARDNRKFEKDVSARARMTEGQRDAEDRRQLQASGRKREFISQIPDLYTFKLLGDEELRGRASWVIEAEPRRDAHPRGFTAGNLSHLRGTVWIDKTDGRWARVEAIAPRDINFGLFLARIHEGSRITFEQSKLNDEVWLPLRIVGTFSARLGFAQVSLQSETTYFDYRRFHANSTIVSTGPAQ